MKENKDETRRVATCFEGTPCAEMLEKILGEEGVGSLCEEMMKQEQKANKKGEQK